MDRIGRGCLFAVLAGCLLFRFRHIYSKDILRFKFNINYVEMNKNFKLIKSRIIRSYKFKNFIKIIKLAIFVLFINLNNF